MADELGNPLSNVLVQFQSSDNDYIGSAVSDLNGNYSFTFNRFDSVKLILSKEDYETYNINNVTVDAETVSLPDIVFRMDSSFTAKIYVVDSRTNAFLYGGSFIIVLVNNAWWSVGGYANSHNDLPFTVDEPCLCSINVTLNGYESVTELIKVKSDGDSFTIFLNPIKKE